MNYPPEFLTVCDRIFNAEGGYNNIVSDPGGETKYGISKRAYPNVDIASLTKEQAIAIQYNDYWMPLRYLQYRSIHYQVFDAAYNHGLGNAIRMLQKTVDVADDGHWGPVSQEAYNKLDENTLLLRFLGYRCRFITKLSTFNLFGAGWINRIAQNLLYAAEDDGKH